MLFHLTSLCCPSLKWVAPLAPGADLAQVTVSNLERIRGVRLKQAHLESVSSYPHTPDLSIYLCAREKQNGTNELALNRTLSVWGFFLLILCNLVFPIKIFYIKTQN